MSSELMSKTNDAWIDLTVERSAQPELRTDVAVINVCTGRAIVNIGSAITISILFVKIIKEKQ